MRTFAFEDIDVGDGWVASFQVEAVPAGELGEDSDEFLHLLAYWAAHADGRTIVCITEEDSTTGDCEEGFWEKMKLKIEEWLDANCSSIEKAESLSSKLRVERDLRARMKGETK